MENIVHTRLLQKSLPKDIVERKSLYKLLSDNLAKSLILICAPAGYGKTTLAADFITHKKVKFSWLQIHSDMDNFYSFITYITHSLQKLKPEFGKSTIGLIEDYRERFGLTRSLGNTINDILAVFLNEFVSHFKEDVTIVIDDLSNISNSEWLSKCFNMIFENIPPNMHFVITTREMPDFNLSVLKAKRSLLMIGSEDLAFTVDETGELLRTNYSLNSSESEIKTLRNYLGGWVTGIHLVVQSSEGELGSLRLDKMIIMEDIYNYFTEDIFNSLHADTRTFLINTSLLESFSAELSNYIFSSKKSGSIINELLSKNIFIQVDTSRSGEDSTYYTYHTLFRKFLNAKFRDSIDENEAKNVLTKAAEFYLKKLDYLNTINYFLQSGNIKRTVKLIEENFQHYYASGSYEILWNWFESIGNEVLSGHPEMLYNKAVLLRFYKGEIENSLSLLEQTIKSAKTAKKYELLAKAVILRSRNLISIGKITESIKNLESISSAKIKKDINAKIRYIRAYAFYQNGDYDKALPELDKGIEELEKAKATADTNNTQLAMFNLYGHIYLIRGDYSKSASYYEQVLKRSNRVFDKFETYCNLILLSAQSGKFEKALEYANENKTIAETISIPIFRITYLLALQSVNFEFGDYEGSIALLGEINRIASEISHKYYIFLSYSLIGDSYYYLNKLSKAEEYYDLAFRYVNNNSELERIQYSFTKAILLKKDKPDEGTGEVLEKAYQYYKANKFSYNKAQSAFHLADYYYKTKNYGTSLKYLDESLALSKEKEYVSFLQRDFTDLRYLFDFAVANNVQKDFVKLLMHSNIGRENQSWISDEAKARLEESGDYNYDLQLKTFGSPEIILRGTVIDDTYWSKKKWKAIFIYLLLNPKKELSKDKIIDVFYPDTSIESADNIFHQIVSKFRAIMKAPAAETAAAETATAEISSSKKGKEEQQVPLLAPLVTYEDKILRINNDFIYYIDCFELDRIYKKISPVKNSVRKLELLKAAESIYGGEFLEGNYETWAEELRTKYLSYYTEICEELIETLFMLRDFELAIEYSDKLLRQDKFNLNAYEYSLKSLEAMDKQKQAKERLARFSKIYEKEYGEGLPLSFTSKFKSLV